MEIHRCLVRHSASKTAYPAGTVVGAGPPYPHNRARHFG
jgi:hypothetical protein